MIEKLQPAIKAVLTAVLTRRKRIFIGVVTCLFLLALVALAHLIGTYSHYAAVIDARLADQSLLYPAGIYAAPRRVSVGQQVTREELVERLLRAGYQDGGGAHDFAAGSFALTADGVEIRTSSFARGESLPALARVSFNKNQVSRIADAEQDRALRALLLPAEMLTAEPNAKKQTRRATGYDELPRHLVAAVTAIEDRRFFSHSGVDLRGIFRALYRNLRSGRVVEGGSTITQQLIKNQFLTPERTFARKLSEALMAVALERRLSKEQILTLYCDRIYLGHSGITSIYGFKQAARIYFGKALGEITLSEAALLAGLAQAPNRYAPHTRLGDAVARRDAVLNAMVEAGAVSGEEAAAAKREEIALQPPQRLDDSAAPHFVDYLKREMARTRIDEEAWPQLRVETTLDLDLQQAANRAVAAHLDRLAKVTKRRDGVRPEAALVALDPQSGEILAMVGGRDYATSQLNRVTDASRQPGSVFKPVVYAAALTSGISPASTFTDAPHEIQYAGHSVYRPQNYGRGYSNRPVMLREAMVRSLNVVAVDAALQAGLGRVAEMAAKMGLPKPETYPSLALGAFEATPLEVAGAYTTFANGGLRATPYAVRAVKSLGQEVAHGASTKVGVLSESMAYLVTDALADVVNRGTASRVRALGYRGPAAGKTGTSRDAWFVGYTPRLLVAVWVGYDDHKDLGLLGGEAAVPIWADFVKRALELRPDLNAAKFRQPSGLETVDVCAENGLLAGEYCAQKQRLLLAAYLLPSFCYTHYEPPTEVAELPTTDGAPILDYGEAVSQPLLFEAGYAPPAEEAAEETDSPQGNP
jgi:penicillin-binding protein 1B